MSNCCTHLFSTHSTTRWTRGLFIPAKKSISLIYNYPHTRKKAVRAQKCRWWQFTLHQCSDHNGTVSSKLPSTQRNTEVQELEQCKSISQQFHFFPRCFMKAQIKSHNANPFWFLKGAWENLNILLVFGARVNMQGTFIGHSCTGNCLQKSFYN